MSDLSDRINNFVQKGMAGGRWTNKPTGPERATERSLDEGKPIEVEHENIHQFTGGRGADPNRNKKTKDKSFAQIAREAEASMRKSKNALDLPKQNKVQTLASASLGNEKSVQHHAEEFANKGISPKDQLKSEKHKYSNPRNIQNMNKSLIDRIYEFIEKSKEKFDYSQEITPHTPNYQIRQRTKNAMNTKAKKKEAQFKNVWKPGDPVYTDTGFGELHHHDSSGHLD
jgi:hypothetical protein